MQTTPAVVTTIRVLLLTLFLTVSCSAVASVKDPVELSDTEIKDIVLRTYQYVAMYNVNNKFAHVQGGWNTVVADTELKDHTIKEIARPNNDTLYIGCMLDLRKDPVIIDIPAFDSLYVSLMVTGYDHYVNVPLSVTKGDFKKPEKVMFYTSRTEGYDGKPVEGVDRSFEMTGDFVSAVFRVMPHANDAALFKKIEGQMQAVQISTLSEFNGKEAKDFENITFPVVGQTDLDVYENNFLEVMQFVVNHTTFDPKDKLDKGLLEVLKPLGVEPGKTYDPKGVTTIDSKKFRAIAEQMRQIKFARAMDSAVMEEHGMSLFRLKGKIPLHILVLQSVIGPIGLPATEAIYPPVTSNNGEPLNAQNDYIIRMEKDELPPAIAFWSLTLYDTANGFFIPNDHKKYSVGENAGMQLNNDGGIDIYVAAKKPDNVPVENWLPINRQDEVLDILLRIYVPDLKRYKTWKPPVAEILE